MEKLTLGSYQERYKANKLQMIKSKKGRIVSLELLEDLKKTDSNVDIDVNVVFSPKICLQKHLFNQGFLLPYKFSKDLEKAKLTLFLLKDNEHISESEFKISLFELNEKVNKEIDKILVKYTEQDWEVSQVKMNKTK
jgi:hypothetical protein